MQELLEAVTKCNRFASSYPLGQSPEQILDFLSPSQVLKPFQLMGSLASVTADFV